MTEEKLDTSELISQIRLRGIKPSQIFSKDELQEDSGFAKVIQAEVDYQLWLKDKEVEELNEQMSKEIEQEEKLKSENDMIPGPGEEEKGKKKEEENELIPDVENEDSENSKNNPFIPD